MEGRFRFSGTAPRSGVTTAGVSFWRICIADDTKIRVFDVTGPQPREVDGLDRKIRKEINAHIPTDESTLWLVYPLKLVSLRTIPRQLL